MTDLAPTLTVNGAPTALVAASTVTDLLRQLDIDPAVGGIAVAVNGVVVPRSRWTQTTLTAGDDVEIIRATAGG